MSSEAQMKQTEQLLVTIFICVIGGMMLIVGLGIYFENELTQLFFSDSAGGKPSSSGGADTRDRRASVPTGTAGTNDNAAQPVDGPRVYSSSVRLEELLRWPAIEAARALRRHTNEMSGDDTEAYFAALDHVANCILGINPTPGTSKGWFNQQMLAMIEPGRNPRLAAELHRALLDLLSAVPLQQPGGARPGGRGNQEKQPGSLFTLLQERHRRGAAAHIKYRFTEMPRPAFVYPSSGQPQVVAKLAIQQQPQPIATSAQQAGAASAVQHQLQLTAWEYMLFQFLRWPMPGVGSDTDGGGPLIESVVVPMPSAVGTLPFGIAGSQQVVLYYELLHGYLERFVPPRLTGEQMRGISLDELRRALAMRGLSTDGDGDALRKRLNDHERERERPNAASTRDGELLLHAMCQFWLCQNAAPHQEAYMSPPMGPALPTSAAILGCLREVVRHLNKVAFAHVDAMGGGGGASSAHGGAPQTPHHGNGGGGAVVPAGGAGGLGGGADLYAGTPHSILQKPLFDFFAIQLQHLPETSARVNQLIRLVVLYLQPWAPPNPPKGSVGSPGAVLPSAAKPADADAARAEMVVTHWQLQAAERWAWAPFVKRSFPFFMRLLSRVAKECCATPPRFDLANKREMEMLHLVAALFLQPHVLPLLRTMCEAAAKLSQNLDWQSDADCRLLRDSLIYYEVTDPACVEACKKLALRAVYQELDVYQEWLNKRLSDVKKKTQTGGLAAIFDEGYGASGLQPQLEKLIDANERIMGALRPLRLPEKKAAQEVQAAATKLLPLSPRPLDVAGRAELMRGATRCSALRVPFRATPRLPVRPVASGELAPLVLAAEALAPRLPPQVTAPWPAGLGLHPRLLASGLGLALGLVLPAALLGVAPSVSSPLHRFMWWLLLLCNGGFGWVHYQRWWRRNQPTTAAASESWLPWITEQIRRGVADDELRAYLEKTLPENAHYGHAGGATSVDEMLERARRKLR